MQSGPDISSSILNIFYGSNGSPINTTNSQLDTSWSGFTSNTPCVAANSYVGKFILSFLSRDFVTFSSGTCTFGDLYVKAPASNFIIVVEVGGVMSNPINLAVGSLGTILHNDSNCINLAFS